MGDSSPLLDSQETAIFNIIEGDDRFSTSAFRWHPPKHREDEPKRYVTPGDDSQTLIHEPSGYRVKFSLKERRSPSRSPEPRYRVQLSPAKSSRQATIPNATWETARTAVRRWLDFVHREHTTVNPWEQVRSAAPEGLLPKSARDIPPGERFDSDEQAVVRQRLDDLEQEFQSYRDLTEEQLDVLHDEIDTLREDLGEMEKFKWMKLAVGTSFNLIDVLDVDPARVARSVHDLLEFVSNLPDQLPPV